PAVWVGGLSYSLYLWHWPLLVAATGLWGELGGKKGLVVAAVSFVPAWLSYKLVENPFRFAAPVARSNRLALSLGANFSLVGVAAGWVLMWVVPQVGANPEQEQQAQGAAALHHGGSASAEAPPGSVASLASIGWFIPQATQAPESVPSAYEDGCQQNQTDPEPIVCEYGAADGHIALAVVGDSKIVQWQSAIEQIANDQGWHVYSITKSGCGFSAGMTLDEDVPYTSCQEWNENVMAELTDLKPDAVLVSSRETEALESW